jgi:hypothetical protein
VSAYSQLETGIFPNGVVTDKKVSWLCGWASNLNEHYEASSIYIAGGFLSIKTTKTKVIVVFFSINLYCNVVKSYDGIETS